jgi:hypothetical protein
MFLYFIIISSKGVGMDNIAVQPQIVQSQAVQPQAVQIPNYSGVNIQIFNPTVAAPGAVIPPSNINAGNYSTNPVYPANYYTQNLAQQQSITPTQPAQATQTQTTQPVQPVKEVEDSKKKTEKRPVVKLSDDYIKNLESYLNSQDKKERLAGAKEVLARLQEDDSRKNDEALRALVNKMLQDPYQPVRIVGLVALEQEMVLPNDKSIAVLKQIQTKQTKDHADQMQASSILLKSTGTKTNKEFEVTDKSKSKSEADK